MDDLVGPNTDRGPSLAISFGRVAFPLDVRPEEIFIDNIARSLSHQCRFLGHVRKFYSVAQHSVIVSQCVPKELALTGLLHDVAEAYIGDIVRPVRRALTNKGVGHVLHEIEFRIESAASRRFGVLFPLPEAVLLADNAVLMTERRDVLHNNDVDWGANTPPPLPITIEPLPPELAELHFMRRYHDLGGRYILPAG